MTNQNLTFAQIAKQYSNEEEAYKFLEGVRWENGVICPHCGNVGANLIPANTARKTTTGKVTFRRVWRCEGCQKQFSVLVGTVFEDSRIPLSKCSAYAVDEEKEEN
jgi:transposase-like protein